MSDKLTTKTKNAKLTNGKSTQEPNSLAARALETQKTSEAARKRARLAKAKYKQARKAFKQAKRAAKQARKEAKLVAKALEAQVKSARKKSSARSVSRKRVQSTRETAPTSQPRILVKKPAVQSSLPQSDTPPVSDIVPTRNVAG